MNKQPIGEFRFNGPPVWDDKETETFSFLGTEFGDIRSLPTYKYPYMDEEGNVQGVEVPYSFHQWIQSLVKENKDLRNQVRTLSAVIGMNSNA